MLKDIMTSLPLLFRRLSPALPLLLAAVIFAPAALAAEDCEPDGSGNGECEAADLQPMTIAEAVASCPDVQCLASALASATAFHEDHFEKKPLLLHLDPSFLGDARMNRGDVVSLIDEGLPWGTGVSLAGWQSGSPNPSAHLKGTPATRSQFDGPAALPAAKVLTTHIGAVQTVHEGVANLTLTFQRTMGHVASADLYATPPGHKSATNLQTARMDGYVFQMVGTKRWTVYAPLPEAHNPVWGVHGNAEWGKGGEGPIPEDIVGEKVLDTVLRPGDVLYIPRGFPHAAAAADVDADDREHSVSVTVSLHTEALHLVQEKVLRCTFARAGYCEEPVPNNSGERYCPIGIPLSKYARTAGGSASRGSLPLGFLNPGGDWFGFVRGMAKQAERAMRRVLELAEEGGTRGVEDLIDDPDNLNKLDKELAAVAGAVFQVQSRDLSAIEKTFAPNNADVPFGERQQRWLRLFGRLGAFQGGFCHEGGPQVFFKDYFSPDLPRDTISLRMDRMAASRTAMMYQP